MYAAVFLHCLDLGGGTVAFWCQLAGCFPVHELFALFVPCFRVLCWVYVKAAVLRVTLTQVD